MLLEAAEGLKRSTKAVEPNLKGRSHQLSIMKKGTNISLKEESVGRVVLHGRAQHDEHKLQQVKDVSLRNCRQHTVSMTR